MAKNRYSLDDLKRMGLVEVSPGVYKSVNQGKTSPYIEQQKGNLVVREKVVETPNFTVNIKTEWFIKGYNVPSKKNGRQSFVNKKTGKQVNIPSKLHAEFKKMTSMQFAVFGVEFRSAVKALGLEYPLRIEFTFVRDSKRRFDYANSLQTCEDLMVENKWIEDDSADHLIPSFGLYEIDKNCPGVKIKLLTK